MKSKAAISTGIGSLITFALMAYFFLNPSSQLKSSSNPFNLVNIAGVLVIGMWMAIIVMFVRGSYRAKKDQEKFDKSFAAVYERNDRIAAMQKIEDFHDKNNYLTQLDIIMVSEGEEPEKQIINERLWIVTRPINTLIPSDDLPDKKTTSGEIYRIAAEKSAVRLEMSDLTLEDGRYCPIDHIVTADQSVQTCPKCSRSLLWFGWE